MGDKDDPGSFLYAMTRAVQHWRYHLDIEMRQFDLTEAVCRPLMWIDRLGDGVRQKDLAYELEIEGSSLVPILHSLEKKGLVERRPRNDRREKGLFLTSKGRALVEKTRSLTDSLHTEWLGALSKTQKAACMSAFEKLDEAFSRHELKREKSISKTWKRSGRPRLR